MDLWNDPPPRPLPCSVSEFLLGEVDSSTLLAVPPGDPSQVSRRGGHICLGHRVCGGGTAISTG